MKKLTFLPIFFSFLFSLNAQIKDSLKLYVAEQTLIAGNAYSFPVFSSNFDNILSFQFALDLSSEYVDSVSLFTSNLPGMEKNFHWLESKNQLRILWLDESNIPRTLPASSSLFTIYLKMKKTIQVKDLISIDYKAILSECVGKSIDLSSDKIMGVELKYDPLISANLLAVIDHKASKKNVEFFPNPVCHGKSIQIKFPQEANSCHFINMKGSVIYSLDLLPSANILEVPASLIAGNYIVQFFSDKGLISQRLLEVID